MLHPSYTLLLLTAIRQNIPRIVQAPDFFFTCSEMVDARVCTVWVGTDQVKARQILLRVAEDRLLAPNQTKATS